MNNSRGTNHEPWWTSCPNLILSEKQPPEKACWQTVGKVQFKPLQSYSRPVIPWIDCGWSRRILWTTRSKAAQRSGKTTCLKVSCVAGSHPSCDCMFGQIQHVLLVLIEIEGYSQVIGFQNQIKASLLWEGVYKGFLSLSREVAHWEQWMYFVHDDREEYTETTND